MAAQVILCFDGIYIKLDFANSSLSSDFSDAFRHLSTSTPRASCDFTLEITHEKPNFTFSLDSVGPKGIIRGSEKAAVPIAYSHASGSVSIYNRETRKALYYIPLGRTIPYWERASPFLFLFQWIFQDLGWTLLHAGALEVDGKGLLLIGKGGSGKSTTALSALFTGKHYLADDYCILIPGKNPQIHSLYSSAKATRQTLSLLPFEIKPDEVEEKTTLQLYPKWNSRLLSKTSLDAIFAPSLTPLPPCLSYAEVVRRLVPSTLFQLPGNQALAFTTITTAVKTAAKHSLFLQRDYTLNMEKIAKCLHAH